MRATLEQINACIAEAHAAAEKGGTLGMWERKQTYYQAAILAELRAISEILWNE